MANLIIDLGNTRIKVFVFDEPDIVYSSIVNDYEKLWAENTYLVDKYNIKNAIISSVRDDDKEIISKIENTVNLVQMSTSLKLPVNILYETPHTLGQDRLAAVCGASVLYPCNNVLVIDLGTAITYDILINNNDYLGGTISLGIGTRFKALHNFTGKLPLLNINTNLNGVYGKTTNEAVILGVQNGIMNEVKGVIAAYNKEFEDLFVVFTGGESFFFDNLIKNRIFAEPNIAMFGLNKILKLNV
ncbi:MAG: type III pantothenate kinase [Bacteroidales bacterium]|nr:type III pantothenate kinase [Bacteroidales bacterium]